MEREIPKDFLKNLTLFPIIAECHIGKNWEIWYNINSKAKFKRQNYANMKHIQLQNTNNDC